MSAGPKPSSGIVRDSASSALSKRVNTRARLIDELIPKSDAKLKRMTPTNNTKIFFRKDVIVYFTAHDGESRRFDIVLINCQLRRRSMCAALMCEEYSEYQICIFKNLSRVEV